MINSALNRRGGKISLSSLYYRPLVRSSSLYYRLSGRCDVYNPVSASVDVYDGLDRPEQVRVFLFYAPTTSNVFVAIDTLHGE